MTSGASFQLIAYCVLIVGASLLGGWVPLFWRLTHARTQLLLSFVAGFMLGIGAFHMLVHAWFAVGSADRTVWWMMVGLLTMFFLQRFFHFHQHGPGDLVPDGLGIEGHAGEEHHHGHEHDHGHAHGPSGGSALSWIGLALGLMVHSLSDGMAVAASVTQESLSGHAAGGLYGLGTFLAVVLHKPLDAMAITALMLAGHQSAGRRRWVNLLFALVAPLGAGLFVVGLAQTGTQQQTIAGCALAFSAGTFLCISLSDLLPEIQFHSHDRLKLSAMLLAGIAAAYAIGFLESSGHDHHHGHGGHVHGQQEGDAPKD